MDKSFDFGKLLKNHEKKHKSKPLQFRSVACGVKKRLESNLKIRKSNRLSVFDSIRNLPRCESPAPLTDAQLKVEHRRQQLEKWKEEKEKKRKEAAAQKKKPFLTGVAHVPLKFIPPPPPKVLPSSSGRVTRSQSAKHSSKVKETKDTKSSQSFAPKNASFKPPELKNKTKLPTLAPAKRNNKKSIFTFEPELPKTDKRTRYKPQKAVEAKIVPVPPVKEKKIRSKSQKIADTKVRTNEKTVKSKVTKPNASNTISSSLQSSSSSEVESIRSPILTTSSRKSVAPNSPIISHKTPRKSLQKDLKNVTPKNPVPKSESSSEERLRSPKSSTEGSMTPESTGDEARISPFVTMSRGKDNARREMKKKMDDGLLDEDASNMESVDHFRRQLASEIKRMTDICETWDKIFEQTVLPENVQEAVLAAVGQARLLMSQKMQQFATLVERCAKPEAGSALVTPADLHGFWDMVFMQVENVDLRFKKLEELRSRGWVEQQPVEVKKKAAPKPNAKKPAKPSGGPSRLREMIAAARKAKKEQETETQESLPVPLVAGDADSKTFEAGFFCVRSPIKSLAAPHTPASKNTLLKAVLSSEAKKASASASKQTPINLYATPGRSILKQTSSIKSGKKSIKVVLFDQSGADQDAYLTHESESNGQQDKDDLHTDSGISSMDIEKVEDKENSRRKSKLVRQDAEDRSPVMTRSRRKSMNASVDEATPRRSRKVLQDSEDNVEEKVQSSYRSTRRRKSGVQN